MAEKYDVIVVGAGNGGLMAAASSARMGKKTLLIERHNLAGGAATSFIRGRFEFEVALHELCEYGHADNPRAVRKMYDWLGANVKMQELPDTYRYIIYGKDGFDVKMPAGRENFINAMEKYVPGTSEKMEKLFDLCEQSMNALAEIADGKDKKEVIKKYPAFIEYATKSWDDVLNKLKLPKKAQQILGAYWCYIDIPTDEFEFPYFATMLATYVENDAYIPQRRSHDMSTALAQVIYDNGGDVWLSTTVEKILVENGQAVGVQIKGEKVFAKEVICGITPHAVYGNMMDQKCIPEYALKYANSHKLGTSAFLVYLGLNKSCRELGINDYSVFIASTGDTRKQYENCKTMDKNEFMIMNCLNTVIPNASPKETSVCYITKLVDDGVWDNVKPKDYEKLKVKIAKNAIDEYEQATGIKISDSIEEIAIAAPPTFARYMGTPDGEIYGYHCAPWDQIIGRSMDLKNVVNPLPHLYFCGGHGFMCDGYNVSYTTGLTAAKIAVSDINNMGADHE